MSEVQHTYERRPIQGFPAYEIDTEGRVWSCLANGTGKAGGTWHELVPVKDANGRLRVTLFPGRRVCQLHRLVLETFVGPCPEGMECRHFPDRNPANNRLENLQWGTKKENAADRKVHGTDRLGERNNKAKFTADQIKTMRQEYAEGMAIIALARKYKVAFNAMWSIIRRVTWKHIA